MAFAAKDYRSGGLSSWEKAVTLDPNTRHYHYSLANAYSELVGSMPIWNMRPSVVTSSTPRPRHNWTGHGTSSPVENFPEASAFLDKAVAVDPGDARRWPTWR